MVSSQVDLHARYGGVVPEPAGRAHIELALPVVTDALAGAGLDRAGVVPETLTVRSDRRGGRDLRPGADRCPVGRGEHAKALALAWDVPFVGVNHLEGICSPRCSRRPRLECRSWCCSVSGGHTLLVALDAPAATGCSGQTIDDAAGEAFDKVARYLGLGYPGGPAIDRLARRGDAAVDQLPAGPRPRGPRLSFSGLKTAVVSSSRATPRSTTPTWPPPSRRPWSTCWCQGVAAATARGPGCCALPGGWPPTSAPARFAERPPRSGLAAFLPSRAMCTDNAAMIAAAGYFQLERSGPSPLDTGAVPDLQLHSSR